MDLVTAGATYAVGKKLLGKTFDVVSEDIAKLYECGRDKIIERATAKVADSDDGKSANLRVTRDVFWNGSFTDEAICAEYFGGILASSRSEDGKSDDGVYYVDLIKSLSANQLKLHYLIYCSLNGMFRADAEKAKLNPGQESELAREKTFLSINELVKITGNADIGRDLHALHAKGLIGNFQSEFHKLKNGETVPYLNVSPSSLGVQLYAVAHNHLPEWRKFSTFDFGVFPSISTPQYRGSSMESLLASAGIKDEAPLASA